MLVFGEREKLTKSLSNGSASLKTEGSGMLGLALFLGLSLRGLTSVGYTGEGQFSLPLGAASTEVVSIWKSPETIRLKGRIPLNMTESVNYVCEGSYDGGDGERKILSWKLASQVEPSASGSDMSRDSFHYALVTCSLSLKFPLYLESFILILS